MEKKKLKLSKKVITPLLRDEQKKIKGGLLTTSWLACTGWTCDFCTGSGGTFPQNCCRSYK